MDHFNKILIKKSIRITPMRQLLLEYLLKEQKAYGLTVLEKKFPRADRSTIYRTLKTFEEKGILHRIETGVSEVKYALCEEQCTSQDHADNHPHFHCLHCQQSICLKNIFIPSPTLPENYRTTAISMSIKGICKSCT